MVLYLCCAMNKANCSLCCGVLSCFGFAFLLCIGFMLKKQPVLTLGEFAKGIDVADASTQCFQAAAFYAVSLLLCVPAYAMYAPRPNAFVHNVDSAMASVRRESMAAGGASLTGLAQHNSVNYGSAMA